MAANTKSTMITAIRFFSSEVSLPAAKTKAKNTTAMPTSTKVMSLPDGLRVDARGRRSPRA